MSSGTVNNANQYEVDWNKLMEESDDEDELISDFSSTLRCSDELDLEPRSQNSPMKNKSSDFSFVSTTNPSANEDENVVKLSNDEEIQTDLDSGLGLNSVLDTSSRPDDFPISYNDLPQFTASDAVSTNNQTPTQQRNKRPFHERNLNLPGTNNNERSYSPASSTCSLERPRKAARSNQNYRRPVEFETDPIVLKRRQKQIDYGKNTIGYQNYAKKIPKLKRSKTDVNTPDKFVKYSRRSWEAQIKIWRVRLHEHDPPELRTNKSDKHLSIKRKLEFDQVMDESLENDENKSNKEVDLDVDISDLLDEL